MIGTSLNQYRITDSIGAGGMGEVFRARDTRINRDLVVEVLSNLDNCDEFRF
jgi:serine/threonine protein kinase